MRSQVPLVYVQILNWNGLNDTLACLDSVKKSSYPSFQVVVVENGSRNGEHEASVIKKHHPWVTVIKNTRNLGFAGGHNTGFRHSMSKGADYVLLLNNDAIVAPDLLGRLVSFMQDHPRAGATGAKVYYWHPQDVIWSAGSRLFFGKSWLRGRGDKDVGQYDAPWNAHQVVGAVMLLSARALRTVGLFDDAYFAYYEETKWCCQARQKGFEIWYVPSAKAWHKIAASSGGGTSPLSLYYLVRNRFFLIGDVLPLWQRPFAYLFWVAEVAVRTILYGVKRKRRLLDSLGRGVVDACFGRRGPRLFA